LQPYVELDLYGRCPFWVGPFVIGISPADPEPVGQQETSVQYMFMLYYDESQSPEPGSAAQAELFQAYGAFTAEVKQSGVWQAGDPLQASSTATVVRAPNRGSTVTTDGPFAESKEQLGGYYILDCKDLDEAVELAAKIPTAWHGSVEVRPVMQM
jgi:hypothetical protein